MEDLKDFDQIEEGLHYLDKQSKEIQAARLYEIRRKFLEDSGNISDIREAKTVVEEYNRLYKENKEISAFLLISRQPQKKLQQILQAIENER